ncbi:mechanosensitive ion channel family protein [uncultured Victivallis sp.]|uniref:mechanosensitive ion channel family protein n=1 Tax=uncultured Victivallis sp. TaxID=354118 RepID=UPI0025F66D2B|nr:mechanosensitive ion channel family protein [uncultured Victivallis sp.]
MRRMVWVLMLCLAAAVVAPAEEALSLPELPERVAETSSEKKNPAPEKEREEDTELDRILSGEQALPVLNEERIAAKVDRRFTEAENWFVREKDALFTLLIASGIAILAGAALAFGLRWLVARSDAECRRMRWQFIAALSGPVILMVVSGVIFLFLLPVLHSLPELYPLDARLFFTWITLLAARAGFQLITLLDVKMRAFAKRPDNSLDSLMVDITRKLLKIVLAVVTVLFIGQSIFQLNITTLLAGAGVVGLAVAFASRETLSNFFGTLVIILDRPFRIGDRVQIGDVNGLVQSVGMRSTRVITANESVFSIPNSRIAEQPIENISNRGVIRYTLVLGLDYATSAEQLQQAMTILREITTDFKGKDQPQYFPRIFFEEFGASALNIRVIMWLKTTSFDREEQLRTEVNLTILQRFNEAGLSLAFNTVTNNLTGSVQLLPPPVPASPQS